MLQRERAKLSRSIEFLEARMSENEKMAWRNVSETRRSFLSFLPFFSFRPRAFFADLSSSFLCSWYLALKHAASPQREETPLDQLAPVFSKDVSRRSSLCLSLRRVDPPFAF